MNKAELISAIAAESGLSKVDAKKAVDSFESVVTKALKDGDKVALIGFGTFSVAERSERNGINPLTKQAIKIAARKEAKFKAGAELKAALE
jgi:DNA-binding protein HU-beta